MSNSKPGLKVCGTISQKRPKLWYIIVFQWESLYTNFQLLRCNPSPAIPTSIFKKLRFLRIFKNSYLDFQATNFNLETGIFFFLKLEQKIIGTPYYATPIFPYCLSVARYC